MRVLSLTSALVALASMALASVEAVWPDNGATRLHGVNYDMQNCKNADDEYKDLLAISKIAKSVRVYGLSMDPRCPITRLLKTARDDLHITVHLGMWLSKDTKFENQFNGLLAVINSDAAKANHLFDSNIVGFHVGSEAIYRKDYSADTAISYLTRVRNLFKDKQINVPVTIADVVDSYYQNPQLVDAVDYVSINQFSFWEKTDINYAMVKMLDRIRSIRAQAAAKNKIVMISETGWASGGYDNKNRVGDPKPENEAQFFTNFYHQATAHGLPYYYFVAYDAPWNWQDKDATVEQYFGLMDYYSRQIKPKLANLDFSPRTIVTLQSARGLVAETFNATEPETVNGVEITQPSNDKLVQVRYKWFFDSAKQQYRSLNSDRCLDAYQPQDGGIVHTYQCVDAERNQRWTYDTKTQQLKHASHTGFCLEDHTESGKLELWTCDAFKDNQRFGVNGPPAGSDLTPGTVSPGQPTTSPVPTTTTPVPTTPAPSTCSIEENVDYSGNDIGSALSATAEGCCAICQARNGCKAFTWTNYSGGTCWLKSSKTGSTSKSGARSAVVSSITPPPVPTTTAPVPTTTAPAPTTTAPAPTTTAPAPTTTAPTPTTTAPVPTTPTPSTCSIEENVDYSGNDIGSALSATAEGCCSICQARSGCKAFTWTNYAGGTCWLKSSKTGSTSKTGARSAVVSSTPTPQPGQCSAVELNVDYSGNDIGSAPSSSVDGCCSICAQRSGCGAYTWSDYNGGTCWLKSSKGTATPKAGAKSAVYTGATNTCTLTNGIDYYGNDLASAASATAGGCCSICKGRSGCVVFTWTSDNGGTCWLKTAQGTPVPKTGAVSGKV